MKNNLILAASHVRAGTHFLINSLTDNSSGTFPLLQGNYPTLEVFLMPHSVKWTKAWEEYLNGEGIKIVKTHVMPSDIMKAMNTEAYLTNRDRRILETIWKSAKKVYIYRDGRDVLVSWFHLKKDKGAGIFRDEKLRLKDCTFSEFIRMPNHYHIPIRGFENKDKNRVAYLYSHVKEWKQIEDIVSLAYEDLHQNFEITIKDILKKLTLEPNNTMTKPKIDRFHKRTLIHKIARRLRGILVPSHNNRYGHTRKGIIGDWKNHFSKDDLEFFNANYRELSKRRNANET